MWRRAVPLPLFLLALFASVAPGSAIVLDPQVDFSEFNAEAAVHPKGGILLVWTRSRSDVFAPEAMAATLDPVTGQLGELHEWGAGLAHKVVPLGTGYLALRVDGDVFGVDGELFAQRLDEDGRPVGGALSLGSFRTSPAEAQATPDGGAVVLTILRSETTTESVVRAWRFGPDGALLSGPAPIAQNANLAVLGADDAGNLVLAWINRGGAVVARRFSPDLVPLSRVVSVASGPATAVRVAVEPDGRFVVIYSRRGGLWVRAFRADASSNGKSVTIVPQGPRGKLLYEVDAAVGAQGRIFMAWFDYAPGVVPTIQARTLSPAGLPLTRTLRVAQGPAFLSELQHPRVERLPEGDFLVLWTHSGATSGSLRFKRLSGR